MRREENEIAMAATESKLQERRPNERWIDVVKDLKSGS